MKEYMERKMETTISGYTVGIMEKTWKVLGFREMKSFLLLEFRVQGLGIWVQGVGFRARESI